jgi:hypothetical protein
MPGTLAQARDVKQQFPDFFLWGVDSEGIFDLHEKLSFHPELVEGRFDFVTLRSPVPAVTCRQRECHFAGA